MLIRLPGEISYLIGFLLISLGLLVDWWKMNSHELLARGGVYHHTQLGFNPFKSEVILRNYTCEDKRSEVRTAVILSRNEILIFFVILSNLVSYRSMTLWNRYKKSASTEKVGKWERETEDGKQ